MRYNLIKYIVKPIVHLFWIGRVVGLKNVPKKKACIIAANHNSYLDFVILFCLIPRRITFLAAEVFFRKKMWRLIMQSTGQIKVDRKSSDKSEVYDQVDKLMVEDQGCLGIFPEGTRSRSGKMNRGYKGVVKFAKKYNVPVIPVFIENTFLAWPPHKKIPKISKCNIYFGTPYYMDDGDDQALVDILMDNIKKLVQDERK